MTPKEAIDRLLSEISLANPYPCENLDGFIANARVLIRRHFPNELAPLEELLREPKWQATPYVSGMRPIDDLSVNRDRAARRREDIRKFLLLLESTAPSNAFVAPAVVAQPKRRLGQKKKAEPLSSQVRREEVVFIGHGGSDAWRQLAAFLEHRLNLRWIEFNSDSAAGFAVKEILEQMLNQATFAFLVMTAEDEQPDGSVRPRLNVVHEAGLFQGRLGFHRAIVLFEDGCSDFSNIHGLNHIGFAKGNLKSAAEEIREVLERENVIVQ